jgi:hypothetical protein
MNAGIQLNFYLGQRVIYDGMTGKLIALSIEDDVIMGTVALDEPIIIPPICDSGREIRLYKQSVPVHELVAEQ